MTAAASQVAKEAFTRLHQRAAGLPAGQPVGIISRVHHLHMPHHARVIGAAIFGAEEPVRAYTPRLKPFSRVTPRHDVLFDSEFRQEEAVNHVLRSHGELYDPP